ncbi:MAG: hypothetical protein GXN99_00765 [Candidatus Nanohaloarchaeota archaeon]|nr:hypothetical protein [Candidatus Nanohaloarchaeota archaeon]
MNYFELLFTKMKEWGMVDFFFPWMLFTALIYGILQSKKYISEETSVNGAIAISSAFLITYFGRGTFLTTLFWIAGIFMLIILLAGIIGGLFGISFLDFFKDKKWVGYVALGVGVLSLILAIIITSAGSYFGLDRIDWGGVGEIVGLLIAVGAIIGVVWIMSKG